MLRLAREALGLTEHQAAEQLNLEVGVVLALESGDFAALGAPVFAKGHLRRYGALLGVAEAELLQAYEHAKGRPSQPTLIPKAREEMVPVRGPSRWPWVVGGLLLFLLAAGLVAYVSEHGFTLPGRGASDSGAQLAMPEGVTDADTDIAGVATDGPGDVATDTGSAATAPNTAVATGPQSGAPDSAIPGPTSGSAPSEAGGPPVPVGHVRLSLSFATDSWAEVYDGSGRAVLYDLGRAGSERTIAAVAPLSVTLGNAPGVTVVVNGRAARPPTVAAGQTVARFTVGPDGTLR
jgi:cytoskeleton protein RodZ